MKAQIIAQAKVQNVDAFVECFEVKHQPKKAPPPPPTKGSDS